MVVFVFIYIRPNYSSSRMVNYVKVQAIIYLRLTFTCQHDVVALCG